MLNYHEWVTCLILQLIIFNSDFTLGIQIVNPEKYSSLKLLFAPIPSLKSPWNVDFAASGMQVSLGKHPCDNTWMNGKIKLLLDFMKMYFSSELTADKGYYTSKMLVRNTTSHMSASKKMQKKLQFWQTIEPQEDLVADVIWNPRVQVSTHDNIHGTSALGLARVWPWLNFLNFSMHSRTFSGSWVSFSFLLVCFFSHKTVLHILYGGW